MLMVQELTRDVPEAKTLADQFQTGFREASRSYERAKLESKTRIARKHILQGKN